MNTGNSVKVRKDLHSIPQALNDEIGHIFLPSTVTEQRAVPSDRFQKTYSSEENNIRRCFVRTKKTKMHLVSVPV